tara:strand:+ start:930 stop:1325 length:396 start_codon:yes stop_codon:yes gene_type:complete
MDDIYLKDIRHECHKDEELCRWEFVQVKGYEVRIYYKPNEVKGLGFNFYALEKTGHVCNNETKKDEWHKDYCGVECVFEGIAYFDGIRHLYYGNEKTQNFGYHYYPNLEMIASAILKLRELEKKYCIDYDG